MTRVANFPPRPDRLEATPYGLALVKGEPERSEEGRKLLADIDRRVAALAAEERKPR